MDGIDNLVRRAARHASLTVKLRQRLEAQPLEATDREALDVREALDRLPTDQRELVRLILWDGFNLPQAAAILGVSESTARARYQRARIRLRQLLHADEPAIDEPAARKAQAR